MKIQNMIKKITIAVLSVAMMLAPIVNIKAASTDVVDTSKTGSITIHKYDMTGYKCDHIFPFFESESCPYHMDRSL